MTDPMTTLQFATGQSVEWLHEPRGGWGYRWWVPATIVKVGPKRVTIDALLADGTLRRIRVSPENLRPKGD